MAAVSAAGTITSLIQALSWSQRYRLVGGGYQVWDIGLRRHHLPRPTKPVMAGQVVRPSKNTEPAIARLVRATMDMAAASVRKVRFWRAARQGAPSDAERKWMAGTCPAMTPFI